MDLGHERADGVDDHAALGPGGLDHLGGRAVGAQHERGAVGDLGHVVDEDDPLLAEAVDHVPVVDDLVVAVDRRLEDPHHPGQGLDGLLDAGAEAPGLGQHHASHCGHKVQVIGTTLVPMSAPTVTSVTEASPAARAGLAVGDELLSLNGHEPRDVIDFQRLSDAGDLSVLVRRSGAPLARVVRVDKADGEPLGVEVSSAVFDRIRTCDNHCAFCFIYQLPKGMRRSLYLKDDDYRLSFLYGNFTTLTRFTELDAERILTERLGPLFVSIHTTDPELRAQMLRNPKGATSLRWLEVLLDGGIEVHGQIVVCPGVNDGAALEDTLAGILDRYPTLASVGAVPLGLSRYSNEPDHARAHARRGGAGRGDGRGVAGSLPTGAGPPAGLRGRRVLPPGRARRAAGPSLRGLPAARERHRHVARLRRGVRPPGLGRARRGPPRLLRLGRCRPRRGLPGRCACPRPRPDGTSAR